MSTDKELSDSTPRWEVFVDDFQAKTPVEQIRPRKRTNSIADPIGYMRLVNPKRAREMQARRDNLVAQRELSAIDPRVRDFRMGSNVAPEQDPTQLDAITRLRDARRLVAIARDSVNGWPELAKTNPEQAAEFRAEHEAIVRTIHR